MIDQNEVIRFFDSCAASWDAEMIRSDEKIGRILKNAHVGAGSRVLDVACGTGVLIPDYLALGVESVTGIDISPEMIRIAEEKFRQENVRFVCGDVETAELGGGYDAIVVYNAFPHFPDGARLVRFLTGLLKQGGMLTVAHGMSRARIDDHHKGSASHVSNGLMSVTELAGIFSEVLEVTTILSDETMYQVVGRKVSSEELHLIREHEHAHTFAHDGTEHGHTHTHGGFEHTHYHSHDGTEHTHTHGEMARTHVAPAPAPAGGRAFPAEALLAHTVDHNISHLHELEELAGHIDGAAHDELLSAIDTMEMGNELLEKALLLLRSGL